MEVGNLEYAGVLALCFAFPFVFSIIHKRILLKENFRLFNPSVLIAAVPFLIWDIWAVNTGRWEFNPEVITGVKVWNLPIEEVMFFVLIPQSCLLLWAGMKKFESFGEVGKVVSEHKWVVNVSQKPFLGPIIGWFIRSNKHVWPLSAFSSNYKQGKVNSTAKAPKKGFRETINKLKKRI